MMFALFFGDLSDLKHSANFRSFYRTKIFHRVQSHFLEYAFLK